VIGHEAAQAWLRRALQTDRLAHAYLITGPRSVGKRTFALEMAKTLNCLAADVADRPDNTCHQCSMIDRGVHPDVRVVRRAPERRMISMRPPAVPGPPRDYADNVYFIQSDAQLRPMMGRRKVYIILYAEELAEDAGDRLLKTLEEPPPFVLFLLTATERGGVLPTIASRCQELRLQPRPRLQVDSAALEQRRLLAQDMVEALSGSRLDRLLRARALSERWTAHQETVRETLRVWMAWWRDLVLLQLGLTDHVSVGEPVSADLAAGVSRQAARDAAAAIQQTLADLDTNVNPRLVLDLLLLRLPSLSSRV
jgi:DNA polymerase III subunit delta'